MLDQSGAGPGARIVGFVNLQSLPYIPRKITDSIEPFSVLDIYLVMYWLYAELRCVHCFETAFNPKAKIVFYNSFMCKAEYFMKNNRKKK